MCLKKFENEEAALLKIKQPLVANLLSYAGITQIKLKGYSLRYCL
jgi:hypothetical protein